MPFGGAVVKERIRPAALRVFRLRANDAEIVAVRVKFAKGIEDASDRAANWAINAGEGSQLGSTHTRTPFCGGTVWITVPRKRRSRGQALPAARGSGPKADVDWPEPAGLRPEHPPLEVL